MSGAKSVKSYVIRYTRGRFGGEEIVVHGTSAGNARYLHWLDVSDVWPDTKFRDYLSMLTVRRVPNPSGVGEAITVRGRPAQLVRRERGRVWFFYGDGSGPLCAHPSDVQPIADARAAA